MKKIIANPPLSFDVFYLAQPQHTESRTTNSCLRTRIRPVWLKKITEDILHKLYTEKGCNNCHMISFIHCGSEKRVTETASKWRSAS